LVLATVCLAAGVDGDWMGTVKTPNGDMALTFTFKADGDKLTGTVKSQMGDLAITDGKIAGDKITFNVDAGGNTIAHEGTVKGDTIAVHSHSPWGDMDFDLKRAETK
jgi:hypothetical protein